MNADSSRPSPRLSLKWRFALALLNRRFAHELASLSLDGYLAEVGWTRSVRERAVVGRDGTPRPWATYSFLEFIEPRLKREFLLFEYGAGASTAYYAARVGRVVAVEHDPEFAAGLRGALPKNAELWERPLGDSYVNAVAELDRAPDVVSVDGRSRVRCVEAARGRLAAGGVLILDDTERPEYAPAWEALQAQGFRRLDFWGFAPGQAMRRCTTVFYPRDNVLGL